MGRVAGRTAFSLQRCVFKGERTLLVRVTLDAGSIGAGGEPRLLQLKTAVRIMAVATLHYSFKNFMVKRLVEIRLRFVVATHAELRLAGLQHVDCREARLLGVRRCDLRDRARHILVGYE